MHQLARLALAVVGAVLVAEWLVEECGQPRAPATDPPAPETPQTGPKKRAKTKRRPKTA